MENYYSILGINNKSSPIEIKKAYRNLAKKYHPDVSKEKDCEIKFKEISEAYIILSNPESKKVYDEIFNSTKIDDDSFDQFKSKKSKARERASDLVKISLDEIIANLHEGSKEAAFQLSNVILVSLKMILIYFFLDIFISKNPNYLLSILSLIGLIILIPILIKRL